LVHDHFLRFYTAFSAPERPSRRGFPRLHGRERVRARQRIRQWQTQASVGRTGSVPAGHPPRPGSEGVSWTRATVRSTARRTGLGGVFAVLSRAPDVSVAAYLAGGRIGAVAYNAVHITAVPIVLMIAGFAFDQALAISLATIWLAHIGIDRALGYGLKYAGGF